MSREGRHCCVRWLRRRNEMTGFSAPAVNLDIAEILHNPWLELGAFRQTQEPNSWIVTLTDAETNSCYSGLLSQKMLPHHNQFGWMLSRTILQKYAKNFTKELNIKSKYWIIELKIKNILNIFWKFYWYKWIF